MIDGVEYKNLTMEQFVAWAMREILDGFVTRGMAGVKQSLYIVLPAYSEFVAAVRAKKNAH